MCVCVFVSHILFKNNHQNPFSPLFLYPQLGDKLNILCPVWNTSDARAYPEYHSLYMVTRDQYTSCHLDDSAAGAPGAETSGFRWIFGCSAPERRNVFSLFVSPFSPLPGGFEFLPGRDYYVISPSSGFASGLKDRKGGLCRSMNMKMVIRVAGDRRTDGGAEDDDGGNAAVVDEPLEGGAEEEVITQFFHPNHHRYAGKGNNNNNVAPTTTRQRASGGVNLILENVLDNGRDVVVDVVEERNDVGAGRSNVGRSNVGRSNVGRSNVRSSWRRRQEEEEANRIPEIIEDIFDDDEDDEMDVLSNRISTFGGNHDNRIGAAYVIDVITPQRRTGAASSSSASVWSGMTLSSWRRWVTSIATALLFVSTRTSLC